MTKNHVVYKVTNKTNGKVYIGKTYDLKKRKRAHIHDINNELPFHKALLKYGLDNFVWEIIDHAQNKKEIAQKEIYWIKKLNTCIYSKNSNGYNITIGGEGGVSWNSRPVVQFGLNGNYLDEFESGMCASVLTGVDRKSIERCCMGGIKRAGKFIWKYKANWNGENIEPYKKPKSTKNKKIIQLDLNGNFISEFNSLIEASEKTDTCRTTISGCLAGTYLRANGFQWVYKKDYNPKKDYSFKGIREGNGIVQLSLKGYFVKRFNNCAEAAKELNASSHKIIHKALDDDKRTSCGFKWLRYDTYLKTKHHHDNTEVSN